MKAIVLSSFGSADNFEMADLPIPEVRPGEVRIKIQAVSFNPVDYQIRNGQSESRHLRSMILGRDLSGCVAAVHENVTDFRVGDSVWSYVCDLASSGTYAEYVSVPAELVAMKPVSLTHEQAAAVPVAGITASLALNKARAGATTSVFLAGGAGGVGTFAILLARQLGVRNLVTTAGNAKSRAHLIASCGLSHDQIVDYKDGGFIEQAMKRNGGGFDVALDLVGGRMLSACCALLAVDGDLVSITEAPSQDDFETLFQKNASFHSVGANAYSLIEDRAVWRKYREMLEHLSRLFDSGALAPPPIHVLGRLSPEVVKEAHALLESNAVQGKLVMTC
ncbi:MAG: NADPH:quinone reductase [Acidobacteriota bacterium]|jgi:NADPH:quinone reductase-like Zn-dependent oxidoreductase|nr:NADPH:quinone reductase [Acidobacteriota bacterium]